MKKIFIPALLLFTLGAFAQNSEVKNQPIRLAPSTSQVAPVLTGKQLQQPSAGRVRPFTAPSSSEMTQPATTSPAQQNPGALTGVGSIKHSVNREHNAKSAQTKETTPNRINPTDK